jgi:hypothetical protein
MPVALRNNAEGARRIGDVTILPGQVEVIQDDSWSTNPVIKEGRVRSVDEGSAQGRRKSASFVCR